MRTITECCRSVGRLLAGLAVLFILPIEATRAENPARLRVLMTVGGVDYHTGIVRALRANPGIDLVVRDFDETSALFTDAPLDAFDAILMYHRDNAAEPAEQKALTKFLEGGGGVVVLHHSIANYPDWPDWWRNNVGGLYVLYGNDRHPPSRYFAGFEGVAVRVGSHPVTERFNIPWRYQDESYADLWVSDDVTPLLRTTAFGSDEVLAWVGPSKYGRVAYIQPGHGDRIMRDPIYLNLIEDSLNWAATGAAVQ